MNPFQATLPLLRSNIIDRVATCQGNVREFEKCQGIGMLFCQGVREFQTDSNVATLH